MKSKVWFVVPALVLLVLVSCRANSAWGDIDWEKGRMTVRSKKTEHHEGKASREVPIFSELRPFLEEAWEQAQVGQEYVITRYRGDVNLRTQLQRIIKRAVAACWGEVVPKLACRQSH